MPAPFPQLPPPPPPRPDRREAAIEAAMRRFDEAESRPRPRVAERASWWARLDRPRVGALVAVGLVLSIGLPVWIASDHGPPAAVEEEPTALRVAPLRDRPEPRSRPETADAMAPPPVVSRPVAPRSTDAPQEEAASAPPSAARTESAEPAAEQSVQAFAPPAPPPPAPPAASAPPAVAALPAPEASEADNIVVTGSRVSRDRVDVAETRTRAARSAAAPRDRNACTVADPSRDLDRCRATIEAAVPERAVPAVRDGLSLAWRGDLDGALAAFDRAVARAPRSAFARYNRSLLLRRRGEVRRAEADEKRAIALDGRYEPAIK